MMQVNLLRYSDLKNKIELNTLDETTQPICRERSYKRKKKMKQKLKSVNSITFIE
jgi:hypothetical protein